MHRISTLLLLLAASLLTACSSVSTPHLLGEAIDDAAAEEFNGVWKAGDTLFMVRHLGGGEFRAGTSRWNEGDRKFEFDQGLLHIRALGDVMLLHLQEDDEGEVEGAAEYSLARVILTETDEILLIPADAKRFAAAVRAGELKGEVSGGGAGDAPEGFVQGSATNVQLAGTKEEIDAYLTADRVPLLFNVSDCGVMRRIEDAKIE